MADQPTKYESSDDYGKTIQQAVKKLNAALSEGVDEQTVGLSMVHTLVNVVGHLEAQVAAMKSEVDRLPVLSESFYAKFKSLEERASRLEQRD